MSFAVLGLDLSTRSTGWAILDYEHRDIIDAGTINPIGELDHRIDTIADFLDSLVSDGDVGDAYLEGLVAHHPAAIVALGQLHGAVRRDLRRRGINPGVVAPTEVKRHACASGAARKIEMMTAAIERWPAWPPTNDDEADAMWVADLGCARIEAAVRDAT